MNDYESFFSFLEKNQPYFNMDDILVVSHLDTDGVTSLSLFKKFYEDKNPHLKIIQQLDDECIDEISNMPQKNVIILDSGSLKLNSIKKTAQYATAAAAIALKSRDTISDDMSSKNIELILKENKIETK